MEWGIFKPYSREARIVALYWYASGNYSGQRSRLYRVLCRCSNRYRPGRLSVALVKRDEPEAWELFRELAQVDAR